MDDTVYIYEDTGKPYVECPNCREIELEEVIWLKNGARVCPFCYATIHKVKG